MSGSPSQSPGRDDHLLVRGGTAGGRRVGAKMGSVREDEALLALHQAATHP